MRGMNIIVAMSLVILLCLACSQVMANESGVVNGTAGSENIIRVINAEVISVPPGTPEITPFFKTFDLCTTDDCISGYSNITRVSNSIYSINDTIGGQNFTPNSSSDGSGYGGISFTSNPTGALVYAQLTTGDWDYLGSTPGLWYPIDGDRYYIIKISKDGYLDQFWEVYVYDGLITPLDVVLDVAPPVASFTGTPTSGTAPLTVTFTDTSTNTPTSWSWNFGDGSTSTSQNPSHVYSTAGTYTVSLTATNSAGSNIFTRTSYITVSAAAVAPTVTSITPATAPNSGPVSITDITGTGFVLGATPKLTKTGQTNIAATTYTFVSATKMYCTFDLTGKTLGQWNVVVTNPDTQTGTLTNGFTVISGTIAPIASFTGTPISGTAPLTVTFTDTSTNTPTSWSWNFGDGSTSTSQNPSHVYSTASTYTVSLTATNSAGSNIFTRTSYITVSSAVIAPVSNFTGTPTSGTAPLTVTFTDRSTNTPTSWIWNFGDGSTSTSQNPSHVYSTASTYTVSLTATNSAGSNIFTRTSYITVSSAVIAPVASFTGTPTSGTAPLTVTFTDSTTNTPTSWSWSFGDGSSSTLQNPSHVYSTASTYTVSLTATNSAGSNTLTKTNYITVSSGGGPVANFMGTPLSGTAPLTVTFTDLSTNMLTYSSVQNQQVSGSGQTKTIPAQGIPPANGQSGDIPERTSLTTSQVTPDSSCISCGYQQKYPLMHFTQAQLDEMQNQIKVSPKYSASNQYILQGQNLATGSKSLLSYISYTPTQRNQGTCGNCWVWASTGALEIDHTVNTGINDRLSIQYFNSKYNYGQGSSWACCGGWLSTFTNWYNSDKTPIPWSNTNANFADASQSIDCSQGTARAIGDISTVPHYQLNSLTSSTISTYGKGQATAINNIKSALNENKAVVYSFFYGDSGWTDFYNFWGNSNEISIFDPTPYNGETQTGGHSVLIVGYDDTDPTNRYWIVLNSWGTGSTGLRPNGLFRLKMDMNYDAVYYSEGSYGFYQQQTFELLNSDFANSPTTWSWTFGDGITSTSQNPSHTYTSAGTYTVALTATNSAGSNTLTRTNYISVTSVAGVDTTGVYRPGTGFYLKNVAGAWSPTQDQTLTWDNAASDRPIAGDWNNDGYTETGVYRPGYGFYLKNVAGAWDPTQDQTLTWDNAAGDLPIAGDWNADGYSETGVYRPGYGFYLKKVAGSWSPTQDQTLTWATAAGDRPIAGDWNNDGYSETGVYRPGSGFYLKKVAGSWSPTQDQTLTWATAADDRPIAGDWNNDGYSETGVYRPGSGFYLKMVSGAWDPTQDEYLNWDNANGDLPIAGNW